jgi:hypothetical protein
MAMKQPFGITQCVEVPNIMTCREYQDHFMEKGVFNIGASFSLQVGNLDEYA